MTIVVGVLFIMLAFLAGWLGADWLAKKADRFGLISVPNERSSHVERTPTGGGMGMALGVLCAGLFYAIAGKNIPLAVAVVLSFGLALAGFQDDRKGISPSIRLALQLLVIAVMFYMQPPLPVLLPGGIWLSGAALMVVGGLAGLWWLNAFNFMDGIDGLAASQAIFMLAAGCGLMAWTSRLGMDIHIWLAMLAVAAAALGFLMVNWTPARIFMGDAGSLFLGMMILFFVLRTVADGWLSWQTWMVLTAVFLADATTTLLARLLRGHRLVNAHRTHAYQHLARMLGSHEKATLRYVVINVGYLLPLAVLTITWPQWAWAIAIFSVASLSVVALKLGAGQSENA